MASKDFKAPPALSDNISYTTWKKELKIWEAFTSIEKAKQGLMKDSVLTTKELQQYRTLIGQIGWLAGQTRPDLAFDVGNLSGCVKNATVKDVLRANKVLRKAKTENVKLKYSDKNNLKDVKFISYNDASFANLADGGSQGGFVIFQVDSRGNCSPVMWQSKKLRRVVKSAMAAETLIQVDALEACVWLTKLWNEVLYETSDSRSLPVIRSYTDSHQLYDAAHSIRPVQDKRLRVDVAILREMLERKEVQDIEWINSSQQIADSLTKLGASSTKLLNTISNQRLQ